LVAKISRLEHEVKDNKILVHEKTNDVSELQSRLVIKDRENEALSKELSDKSAQLEMAERSLIQIRSFALTKLEKSLREKDEMIHKLEQEKAMMKKCEEGLTAYIRQLGQDREHLILQYNAYSQQLMAQIACLTEQLNARPVRNFEPFFSKEESEMLDANNKCHSLGKDDGSKKSMGWKKIARFFIAQDSRPELELQDLAGRGHGSVHVDFRQVGFEPRKAFLVNVGLGASVTNGVTLSNAVNHVLDAVLTDCEDETTGCFYVASSKLRRCLEPLLLRMSNQTGACLILCEPSQLPFNPSNELLPSESLVFVFGPKECVILAVERLVDMCEADFKSPASRKF